MLTIPEELTQRLEALRVHMDAVDNDTLILRNMPAHHQFFNKHHTNLLVKRVGRGLPFVIGVDEDLQYTGSNPVLVRAFAGAPRREGWRVLLFDHGMARKAGAAVESAMRTLGAGGQPPAPPSSKPGCPAMEAPALLSVFGRDLSQQAKDGAAPPTVGRTTEIEEVAACLLRWGDARLPLITGASGVGKSNLLCAVAGILARRRPHLAVLSVDLASLFTGTLLEPERENLLSALLREVLESRCQVVAVEHMDLALSEVSRGDLLLARAVDDGVGLIGTTLPGGLARFLQAPLERRVHVVTLEELRPDEAVQAVAAAREAIASHHQVQIDEQLAQAAVAAAEPLRGRLPAKAITLLDAAAARASLKGNALIGLDDVYSAAGRMQHVFAEGPE